VNIVGFTIEIYSSILATIGQVEESAGMTVKLKMIRPQVLLTDWFSLFTSFFICIFRKLNSKYVDWTLILLRPLLLFTDKHLSFGSVEMCQTSFCCVVPICRRTLEKMQVPFLSEVYFNNDLHFSIVPIIDGSTHL